MTNNQGPKTGSKRNKKVLQHQSTRSFKSRDERAREEAFCRHYRTIGIQAVAAANSMRAKPATAGTDPAVSATKGEKK